MILRHPSKYSHGDLVLVTRVDLSVNDQISSGRWLGAKLRDLKILVDRFGYDPILVSTWIYTRLIKVRHSVIHLINYTFSHQVGICVTPVYPSTIAGIGIFIILDARFVGSGARRICPAQRIV